MVDKIHRNSLKPGYKLHWYRIEKILGQGGFGITYLAYDFNLDRKAAIKEYLPIELAVREGDNSVHPLTETHGKQFHWGLDRFLNEARTLAKFEHPNIVRVLNVFEANNTAYMVMSYEEGESLQEILVRRKTLEEGELLNILVPILGGLDKIHQMGFIHRDIKPANIFLRQDGSPVLLDFGSARQALGVQTKTLTSLISPGYAPFEQYYSKSDAQGPWTDIYGLGATLYRAVAGVAPMDAVDRSRIILEGGRDTFVAAKEVGKGRYSERFLCAIDHALQFKEEGRPQSITEWKKEFGAPAQEISQQIPQRIPPAENRPTEAATDMPIRGRESMAKPDFDNRTREQKYSSKPWLLALLLITFTGLAWIYRGELQDIVARINPPEQMPVVTIEKKQEAIDIGAQIKKLLAQANLDFEALRLTLPENNNALAGYRKVLQLDPENVAARQGISNIADKLVTLAQHATAAGDFEQADNYLNQASSIMPDAPNIQLARNELNLRIAARKKTEARINALLKDAGTAAEKGDALTVLTKLDQARTIGADTERVDSIRGRLKSRLEELAAAEMEKAQQAVKAKDAVAARTALQRARELKSKADALAGP